ncbi:MAG: hypothetical protein IJ099_02320 [Alphaproteobacteria bacterium]|nr:hypothetical protein [Alphaproteobacteria bacterium]
MSKSIGKVFGTSSVSPYGYENSYTNYLSNYDTTNYDKTLNNLTSQALNMSQNLGDVLPQFQFTVNGSDAARQRAEQAVYQGYVDKLQPQFNQATADLQNSLVNQGLNVGNQAYQRAMNDLQDKQNSALQQAAYQSVIAGQDAFTQSLGDSIDAAKFSNSARQNYIDQILSLLKNSVSGYQNQQQLYSANAAVKNRTAAAKQQAYDNMVSFGSKVGASIAGLGSVG